jgi:hypothetical protein
VKPREKKLSAGGGWGGPRAVGENSEAVGSQRIHMRGRWRESGEGAVAETGSGDARVPEVGGDETRILEELSDVH